MSLLIYALVHDGTFRFACMRMLLGFYLMLFFGAMIWEWRGHR